MPPPIRTRSRLWMPILCLGLACQLGAESPAQEPTPAPAPKPPGWKDPSDGWLDLSETLSKPGRFFPLALPVTEPAIGYGVAGGPVFLRPRLSAGSQGWTRPNVTAVGGLYTSNQSWALLAADSSKWKDDRIETLFGGGLASLNLKYSGEGETSASDSPLEYNLRISGGVAQGKLRLGHSKFFGGLRYLFLEVDASATEPELPAARPEGLGRTDRLAGPAASLCYDSRNNLFTPTQGVYSESTYSYFDPSFGGTVNFQRFDHLTFGYIPIHRRWTLGIRGDVGFSYSNPPFYARPFVTLRGIPAMRYQRQNLAQTEGELRWQFWGRLSAVGFGGAAAVWSADGPEGRSEKVGAGGGGMRYELARKFGLHIGFDIARGTEDWAFYFVFGSAWLRP